MRMAGEDKPKIFENGRDMMLSLGVIVVGMVAVVGTTGLCTINPETSDLSAVREVDGKAFLDMEARGAQGAIRVPDVPADWVANSARRAGIAQQPASVVGRRSEERRVGQECRQGTAPGSWQQ